MNPFTIPLGCLQRNALATLARAFWPSVCGTHHQSFWPIGIGRRTELYPQETPVFFNGVVNVFLTLTAVTKW